MDSQKEETNPSHSGMGQLQDFTSVNNNNENTPSDQITIAEDGEVVLQISSGTDSSLVLTTNYTVLACYIEDDDHNLESWFQTTDDYESDNATNNQVPSSDLSQGITEHTENPSCEDPEMNMLMDQLRIKYYGELQNSECFLSNPLLDENTEYIEFPRQYPENRIGRRNWCTCNNCPDMPTNIESICCHEVDNAREYISDNNCIIVHEFFTIFCQREDTINVVLRTIGQVRSPPAQKDMNRQRRKTAYRTFTAWVHGYLGVGNRRPIPACVVDKVRSAFPDPDQEYMGFKFAQDRPAEFMAFE